jgi:hypothetical protein
VLSKYLFCVSSNRTLFLDDDDDDDDESSACSDDDDVNGCHLLGIMILRQLRLLLVLQDVTDDVDAIVSSDFLAAAADTSEWSRRLLIWATLLRKEQRLLWLFGAIAVIG